MPPSPPARLLVCLLGSLQPWIFALCILPASMAGSCLRPPAANPMLEQQKGDTGSIASLMGCTGLLMGALLKKGQRLALKF